MLVIGFDESNGSHATRIIDAHPDTHSPRQIHDILSEATDDAEYSVIVLIENDVEIASYRNGDDYDLSINAEDEESVEGADTHELEDEDLTLDNI